MSIVENEKERIRHLVAKVRESFDEDRTSIRKELADSLSAAERDCSHLHENPDLDTPEISDIAERMKLRATEFETEHPKLSAVFREFALLLRSMGV